MGLYRWARLESFGETFTLHFSARKRLFIDAVVSNGSATSHFRVILIVAAWGLLESNLVPDRRKSGLREACP
jgi:hypothetical protein